VQIKRSGGDVVLIDLEELDRETRPSLPTTDVER
jgi:hypothetical protein